MRLRQVSKLYDVPLRSYEWCWNFLLHSNFTVGTLPTRAKFANISETVGFRDHLVKQKILTKKFCTCAIFTIFFISISKKIENAKKCYFWPKNGLKTTKSHEKGVENVQMGQKYVKRGQKGPKWANTDQKGVEIDQKRPKTWCKRV